MHISFDFDYTLADSSQGTILCVNYALETMGKGSVADSVIKNTIGLSLESTYTQLLGAGTTAELTEFSALFLEKANDVVVDYIKFYPDTRRTLMSLKLSGHYLSIVSSKYATRINAALKRDGLDSLIDAVIGGEMVSDPKPSPEGLNTAIALSGIAKDDTVYIGDSSVDGQASAAAGVTFIGVLTGTTPSASLEEYNPVRVIDDLSGLGNVITALYGMTNKVQQA